MDYELCAHCCLDSSYEMKLSQVKSIQGAPLPLE